MGTKKIMVGIFWAVPNSFGRQSVLEFSKWFMPSEANSAGFINYPYSHFEVWEDKVKDLGDDCYKYPRGRVIFDTKRNKHMIYADECVKNEVIDELILLYEIENYELLRDEHYVCPRCKHKPFELKYNILRGQDKIGENLIEMSYGRTKILVELGKSLDGNDEKFEQDILQKQYSAVIVSHYHEDHAGLIKYKRDCPVYIGGGAYRIIKAMADFHGEELSENIKTYRNGRSFNIGGIKITPFLCDHSAYDSYMLLFEAGGQSILYTGDFRFHGRKDKYKLLAALPKAVDVLIHEGTNIGKTPCIMTEAELENKAVEIMKSTDGPVFVLQSGSNIDRLVSVYRASKRSGRITYMDNYTSLITTAAGGSIPRPDVFEDVIAFTPRAVHGKRRDMFLEIINKRGLKGIAHGTKRFTMLVRPSMMDYIKKLFAEEDYKGATLIYSMWKGYKDSEDTAVFLSEMQTLGVNIIDLHTSGHASVEDIELLKRTINAKQTVCVHTELRDIVVFDLETTGGNCEKDFIIEIGAVKIENGKICDRFSTLVNSPQMESLPEEVEKLTGITFEQLKTAPTIGDVLQKFYDFAKGCILVAHNLPFDFAFLRNWGFWCRVNFDGFEKDAIDTVALAKQVLGDKVKNYKLSTLADYFNIEFTHHRALDDAEATAKILLELAKL